MLTRVLRTVPLDQVDQRSKAGVYLRRLREDLRRQLGREPSASEALLIDRAAVSTLLIEAIEQHVLSLDSLVGKAGVTACVLQRDQLLVSLSRLLRQLGLKGKAKRAPQTLDEYVRARDAAKN
jgi:hypothetical protein